VVVVGVSVVVVLMVVVMSVVVVFGGGGGCFCWHFDETEQYDPKTKTGGLFTDYVNTFLKMKQEASGWPEWCQSENEKWVEIFDRFGYVFYLRHVGSLSEFSPYAIQHQFG
jgi:hypothetical protein